MISVSKKVGIALLLLTLATPAYAQVCMEKGAGASGKSNMTCDMSYRDQLVACDAVLDPSDAKCKTNPPDPKCIVGTRPACPKKPMPMIDTPNTSFIEQYTPYLWNYPRDDVDPSLPYAGPYALGTPGDTSRTFQIFGNTAPGTKRLASCTAQIKVPTNPTTNGEWAKLVRLQVDNCTNQYIIRAAMYPVQKEATKLLSMDDPTQPSKVLNLAGECQPLKTFTEGENEYDAGHYLEVAWKKTMQDASYRSTTPSAVKCIPCVAGIQACDKEPHLPCQGPGSQGLTLDNPMAPPSPFPEVRLSSISTVNYENINDPTHPFSPRWDYVLNDRDYSNLDPAQLALLSPTALVINTALNVYMSKVDNSVFCAGVRNADNESDAKKKADLMVRVDILSFRKSAFEGALKARSLYNAACYQAPTNWPVKVAAPTWMPIPAFIAFIATSWCFHIDGFTILPPGIIAHNQECWKCFGLSGKVDDESQHPPCTTQYTGSDKTMTGGVLPGGLNKFSMRANCGTNFPKICSDTRRPYTNMNVLKMRYHRTDDDNDKNGDNNVLKNGTGEGMTFKEYFGNHMPYPRIWDMNGVDLQMSPATDRKFQPPTDVTGQYAAIVGIGREAASKVASDAVGADADGKTPLDKHKDERCLAGGWGKTIPIVSFGGVSLTVPDAMTSWTEMKLYEARTLRNIGMSCIGRYEKIFKPGSGENMMLLRNGGMWQQLVITKCERDSHGLTKNCKPMTYKEYTDAGKPADDATTVYIKNLNVQNIPQPWRGYLSAADSDNQFPTWPGDGSPSMDTGLDKATQGDIILMPNGPKDDASKGMRGLAKMAFVIETRLPSNTDCSAPKDGKPPNCYVRVLEPDDGKWPDSCGSTDTWGEMKTRYFYKPGMLPESAKQEYSRISSLSDCQETKISTCEQSAWSKLKVYHIRDDKRTGCKNKHKAVECEKDS